MSDGGYYKNLRGGRGGRGKRGRGNYKSSIKEAFENKNAVNEMGKDNEEIMKRRRERFSNDVKSVKTDYGLISRGDDMRLKTDVKGRIELFEEIQKRVKKLQDNQNNQVEIDFILLNFRKLRESIVSIEQEFDKENKEKNDYEFYKNVYIESVKFALKFGKYESYIPAINHAISKSKIWGFNTEQIQSMEISLAIHLAFVERNYEESFQILNYYIEYEPVINNNDDNQCKNPLICLYKMIINEMNSNSTQWINHYNHQNHHNNSIYKDYISRFHHDHVIRINTEIGKSYRGGEREKLKLKLKDV